MISRSQMNRQLYMGGGITQLPMNQIMVPRGEYGFGSIVKSVGKAVKGVTKGIGDIAKSDIGKAALLAAGAYYAPALFGGTVGFGPTSTYGSFARGLMSPNLIGPMTKAGSLGRSISSAVTGGGAISNLLTGKTGMALSAVGGGLIGHLSSQGMSNEEIEEIQRDPATLSTYLRQYYTNLNPELINQPEAVDRFVKSQLAEYGYATGGRVGRQEYGMGGLIMQLINNPEILKKLQMESPVRQLQTRYMMNLNPEMDQKEVIDYIRENVAYGGRVGFSDGGNDDLEYKGWKKIFLKSNDAAESHPRHSEFIKRFAEETMGQDRSPKVTIKKAYGGPIGEPRENKGGIMELDYRKEGGFVPVGIKEKADDVPAMLSKNEFVFTADAVRGAGEGSVDKGAERLYNIMKTLENGGIV
jgi:hypothetical protein